MRDRPFDHPLGHGPCDAGAVRHPHGLGDPEAGQVAVLAHDRSAVGGEGEDAVEALLHLVALQRGQQVDGAVPRLGEVLVGEGSIDGIVPSSSLRPSTPTGIGRWP
jgi:hypothetical protein